MPDLNFDWKDSDMGPRVFAYGGKPRIGIKAQDTEEGKGVKVLGVDDESAAEKAGIKKDDVITEFDGKKVNSTDELASAAREAKDKSAFKITFNRDGKSQTVEVKTPKKLKTANL
jgi:serine protease Do